MSILLLVFHSYSSKLTLVHNEYYIVPDLERYQGDSQPQKTLSSLEYLLIKPTADDDESDDECFDHRNSLETIFEAGSEGEYGDRSVYEHSPSDQWELSRRESLRCSAQILLNVGCVESAGGQ